MFQDYYYKIQSSYRQSQSNGPDTDEPYENLMRNKGGLEVSKLTDFGTMKQRESRSMIIWIE